MQTIPPPNATIGILGSGQLGRMLAIAARQMGYRVHVLSPDSGTPTGQIADKEFTAAYEDLDAVRQFAQGVDVVTYEFENVPAETAVLCQQFAPLRPGPHVLHIAQNRLREKQFFTANNLPVAPFIAVNTLDDLITGIEKIGLPAVLKTAASGYDGKGQVLIDNCQLSIVNCQLIAETAWEAIGKQPAILESFVEFEREVSMVAARGLDGSFIHYGLIENSHANHILDTSIAPAATPAAVTQQAEEIMRCIMEKLDVVGVLCVEFFLTADNQLLLNEMAPRPHNSGHLTIDACAASQFEQQLRAVCGLPLGDPGYHRPAAMANLLGNLWFSQHGPVLSAAEADAMTHHSPLATLHSPNWTAVLTHPAIKLHLYGKKEARPGRKMGHLTALATTAAEAATIVREAREKLMRDT
ncbi:MAG: 5-(carboxyamino)imidazole ribonucleotide synthase [Chloroflexota bacterium]